MLTLLEHQKHLAASSGGKPELFQFPVTVWPLGSTSLLTSPTSNTITTSTTPSPTPSLSSNDSGFQSAGEHHHRPLTGSQSAPHGQQMSSAHYETLLRQFQTQHHGILLQQQQLYQHYLEQQQKLMQQALLEKKQFEDQQRQLAGMHLQQQQQLQRQQMMLRQLQEQQVLQLQRQQQLLLLQTLGIQQHQASSHAKAKPSVRRIVNKSGTLSLPYSSSPSNPGEMEVAAGGQHSGLGVHRSLSANSSLDSVSSSNGRTSPSVVVVNPPPPQVSQSHEETGEQES